MFTSKLKKTDSRENTGSTSFIGFGTVISGHIESAGDIRIDGTLKGNLTCKAKVVLGAEGLIEGDVNAAQADIMGKVEGKVSTSDLLFLRGNGEVNGDIHAVKLLIEPTASFNGQCKMGANIVELSVDTAIAMNG